MDRLRAPWNHPHRVGPQSVDNSKSEPAIAKGARMNSSAHPAGLAETRPLNYSRSVLECGQSSAAFCIAYQSRRTLVWAALLLSLAGCARFEPHPLSPDKSATAL